jgi:hypothetical protein
MDSFDRWHRRSLAFTLFLLALIVLISSLRAGALSLHQDPDRARATRLGPNGSPCGDGGRQGQNRRMIRCLSHQPGIQVSTAVALKVADCESGFYAKADGGSYHGLFQLGVQEFRTFSHQGPRWVDQEFREHDAWGIYNPRANALAALAHAHDQGWGAWSCA